jgi:hypothetical protein
MENNMNNAVDGRVMVLNTTFNNISAISWSVLLVEETAVPGENHQHVARY